MPDRTDQAALQKFFFDEIQKGEELLAAGESTDKHIWPENSLWYIKWYFSMIAGDFEASVKHLTNAIAISGQPQQLLQVFQQTLPPDVFKMLMTSLASAGASSPASAKVGLEKTLPSCPSLNNACMQISHLLEF